MKKNNLLLCLLLSICTFANAQKSRIINNPKSEYKSKMYDIKKTEITSEYTIVDMRVSYTPNSWLRIDSITTTLKESDGNRTFKLLKSDGYELNKQVIIPESGYIDGTFYFESIPADIPQVDLIGSDRDLTFNYYNIDLKSRKESNLDNSLETRITKEVLLNGKVIDASNQPVVGALVVVVGRITGVSSDAKGYFSLKIPKGATIKASYAVENWTEYKEEGCSVKSRVSGSSSITYTDNGAKFVTIKLPKGSNEPAYPQPDKEPSYPGGVSALNKFLESNMKYPSEVKKNGIPRRVICQFIITKNGTIANPQVLQKKNTLFEVEAIRIISLMPKWIPGKVKGKPVDTKYILPISFGSSEK